MRFEKELMFKEIHGRLEESVFFILADFGGLTVEKDQDLRGKLREQDAEIHVVKNNVFRHVAKDLGLEEMQSALTGPTAIVSGKGEVTETLKVLKAFVKENEIPVLKVGALEGAFLSNEDIEILTNLPSRDELIAKAVGSIAAPLSGMVGVMNNMVSSLVHVLKAIENTKGEAA